MSFSNLLFLFPLLTFLPNCFLGRVDVIDEARKGAEKGTQEQTEIETFVSEAKALKALKQFQTEEIGGLEQKETQNISTNGRRQMMLCQCDPSSKRNIASGP